MKTKLVLFLLAFFTQVSFAHALSAVSCSSDDKSTLITVSAGDNPVAEYRKTTGLASGYEVLQNIVVTSENDTYHFHSEKTSAGYQGQQYQSVDVQISMLTLQGTATWGLSYQGLHFGEEPFSDTLNCAMEPLAPSDVTTVESLFVQSACEGKLDEVRAYLSIPTLNVNYVAKNGDNALLCAARANQLDTVRVLLDHTPALDRMVRSRIDSKVLIHFLLPQEIRNRLYTELLPAEIATPDGTGSTIFHQNLPLVEYQGALAKVPASLILQKNADGKTPFATATGDWLNWLIENTSEIPFESNFSLVNYLTHDGAFDDARAEALLAKRPPEAQFILDCRTFGLLKGFLRSANLKWAQRTMQTCNIQSAADLAKPDGYPSRVISRGNYSDTDDLLTSLWLRTPSFCLWTLSEHPEQIFDRRAAPIPAMYQTMQTLGLVDQSCTEFYNSLLLQKRFPDDLAYFYEQNGSRRFRESAVEIIPVEIPNGPILQTREYYFYVKMEEYGRIGAVAGKLHANTDGTYAVLEKRFYPFETYNDFGNKFDHEVITDELLQYLRHFLDYRSTLSPDVGNSIAWMISGNYRMDLIPGTTYYITGKTVRDLRLPLGDSQIATVSDSDWGQSFLTFSDPKDPMNRRLYALHFIKQANLGEPQQPIAKLTMTEMAWQDGKLVFPRSITVVNSKDGFVSKDDPYYTSFDLLPFFSAEADSISFQWQVSAKDSVFFSIPLDASTANKVFDLADLPSIQYTYDKAKWFDYFQFSSPLGYGLETAPLMAPPEQYRDGQQRPSFITSEGGYLQGTIDDNGPRFNLKLEFEGKLPVVRIQNICFGFDLQCGTGEIPNQNESKY